jgi:hypothetical protein
VAASEIADELRAWHAADKTNRRTGQGSQSVELRTIADHDEVSIEAGGGRNEQIDAAIGEETCGHEQESVIRLGQLNVLEADGRMDYLRLTAPNSSYSISHRSRTRDQHIRTTSGAAIPPTEGRPHGASRNATCA